MGEYSHPGKIDPAESLRLEAVTVSVGFDDFLDVALQANHGQLDTMIVVTAHHDHKTKAVARKHGAILVETDLIRKNGREFNKGAAINAGFGHFQYQGWRLHLDADIVLPDNFRRILFNHTHLDKAGLYGCDRVDVVGQGEIHDVRNHRHPQHRHSALVESQMDRAIGARYLDPLNGYLPLGFFQLWHAQCQKDYPYSLGSAAHDDTLFSASWPRSHRHHLPGVIVYHLCAEKPTWGENWNGRNHKRLS